MDNFSKGFFTKLAELGVSPEQSVRLYKFADEAAGQGWQDTAKDYANSYGGYGLGGALAGGLLGALFNKKDRWRGALMGALAGGAGGAGLYGHNKAMDEAAATLASTRGQHEQEIGALNTQHAQEIRALGAQREQELADAATELASAKDQYTKEIKALNAEHAKALADAGAERDSLLQDINAMSGQMRGLQELTGLPAHEYMPLVQALSAAYAGNPGAVDMLSDEDLVNAIMYMQDVADSAPSGSEYDPSKLIDYATKLRQDRAAGRALDARIAALSQPVSPDITPEAASARLAALQAAMASLEKQQRASAAAAERADRQRRADLAAAQKERDARKKRGTRTGRSEW